jgi:hypothetical protein
LVILITGRQDGSYKKGSDSKTKDISNTQNVVPPAQPRPKKFFKSRNAEFNTTAAPSPPSAPASIRKYTKPPARYVYLLSMFISIGF